MRLDAAKAHVQAANEASLTAEKEKDAAEAELEALERVLDPTRGRARRTPPLRSRMAQRQRRTTCSSPVENTPVFTRTSVSMSVCCFPVVM